MQRITLLDQDGNEIPSDELDINFSDSNGAFTATITIPESYDANDITLAAKEDEEQIPEVGPNFRPVYQSYNSNVNNHLPTTVKSEAEDSYVGAGFVFFALAIQVEGTHPIIRCYDALQINHYLAKSSSGCDQATHSTEGIFGYLYSDGSKGKPVYLCHNSEPLNADSLVSMDGCRNGYAFKEIIGYAP